MILKWGWWLSHRVMSNSFDPMVWSPLGSSALWILQTKILEWVAMPFSRGSSQPRDKTQISCNAGRFFTDWATSSVQFSSVAQLSPALCDPHEPQHARPPCPSPTPRVHSNLFPLSHWCHPTISSSAIPSPPALNPSQHQSLFQRVNSSHEVAKVLAFQLQHQSFQWTPRIDLL